MTPTSISSRPALTSIDGGLVTDANEVLLFLTSFRPGEPILLTSLPAGKRGGPVSRAFTPSEHGAAIDWVRQQNQSRNVYFHIAMWTAATAGLIQRGDKPKLTKADVENVAHLWVDIDPPASENQETWREATVEKLRAFPLPPTFILSSGGGLWAFWGLTSPFHIGGDVARAQLLECYTRGLALQFEAIGGDKAFDVARIARLPGSVNWPDERKKAKGRSAAVAQVIEWRPERRYDLQQFDAYAGTMGGGPEQSTHITRPEDLGPIPSISSLAQVPELAGDQHADLRALIITGDGAKQYSSRSEAFLAAAGGLARAGVCDAAVFAILTSPDFGVSAHARDSNDPGRAALRAIQRVRDGARGRAFVTNAKGQITAKSMGNVRLAIERLGVNVRNNLLTGELRIEGLDDVEPDQLNSALIRIRAKIEARFCFTPEKDMLADVVADIGHDNAFHPIRDYLDSLVWDGVARLDSWLSTYLGAQDTPLNRAFGRKFLVAGVRRVRKPGTKFDEMLVLEGEQGTFKSTALATLAKDEKWFCDDVPIGASTKEIMETLSGVWIAEVSELSAVKKGDIDRTKQVLAKTHDKARLAYARYESVRPRTCVFAGTTNSQQYLSDPTGNRRFWPVRTGRIDIEALRRDVDQLWAEAALCERTGEGLFLDADLRTQAAVAQGERSAEDPWAAALREALGDICGKVRPGDLLSIVGKPVERQTQHDLRRLGEVMRSIGWAREKQRFGTGPAWSYVRRTVEGTSLREIVVDVTPVGGGVPPAIRVRYADQIRAF